MKQVTINEVSLDELLSKLSEFIKAILDKSKLPPDINRATYLTREEAAKLLKIQLPTLGAYTKQGWLQSYKIGHRVLYKADEVQAAIQKANNL